jgi:hypothetical protein
METGVAAVTVSDVLPEIDPIVAVIVALPAPSPVANPKLAALALTVAIEELDDAQVTCVVRSCVLLSLYVPVAMNCSAVPSAMEGLAGATAIDTSVIPTARLTEPLTEPNFALMVQVPLACVVTMPPAATAATVVSEESHFADDVTSWVLPSVYEAIAFKG